MATAEINRPSPEIQSLDVVLYEKAADAYRQMLHQRDFRPFQEMDIIDIVTRANDPQHESALKNFEEVGPGAAFAPHLTLTFFENEAIIAGRANRIYLEQRAFNVAPTTPEEAVAQLKTTLTPPLFSAIREKFEDDVQLGLRDELADRILDASQTLHQPEFDVFLDACAAYRSSDVTYVAELAEYCYRKSRQATDSKQQERLSQVFGVLGRFDERVVPSRDARGRKTVPLSVSRVKEILIDGELLGVLTTRRSRFARRPKVEALREQFGAYYEAIGSEFPELPTESQPEKGETLATRLKHQSATLLQQGGQELLERLSNADSRRIIGGLLGAAVVTGIAASGLANAPAAQAAERISATSLQLPEMPTFTPAGSLFHVDNSTAGSEQLATAPDVSNPPELHELGAVADSVANPDTKVDLTGLSLISNEQADQIMAEAKQYDGKSSEKISDEVFTKHIIALASSNRKAVDGDTLAKWFIAYEKKYGNEVITKELVAAQMWQESRFNPKAKSGVGAKGMGQFMPGTADQVGLTNPWDPEASIEATYKYMVSLHRAVQKRFPHATVAQQQALSLASYNAGPGNVRKYGGVPPFKETRAYVRIIEGHVQKIHALQHKAAQAERAHVQAVRHQQAVVAAQHKKATGKHRVEQQPIQLTPAGEVIQLLGSAATSNAPLETPPPVDLAPAPVLDPVIPGAPAVTLSNLTPESPDTMSPVTPAQQTPDTQPPILGPAPELANQVPTSPETADGNQSTASTQPSTDGQMNTAPDTETPAIQLKSLDVQETTPDVSVDLGTVDVVQPAPVAVAKPEKPKAKPHTKPENKDHQKRSTETSSPRIHPTTTGEKVPDRWHGWLYYNQHDKRWADAKYAAGGDGGTISRSGCGAASMAMVIASLKNDPSITPVTIADYNMQHDYKVPDGGTKHSAFTAAAEHFGLRAFSVHKNVSEFKKVLDRGGLVVVNGRDRDPNTPATSGGHIYVVRDITSEGKFLVLDPNKFYMTTQSYDPKADIFDAETVAIAVLPAK